MFRKKVIAGVTQWYIDGPLLFDLFVNDLVLLLTQYFLSNYEVNKNLYSTYNNHELARMNLQTDFRAITNWFFENYDTELWEMLLYEYLNKRQILFQSLINSQFS